MSAPENGEVRFVVNTEEAERVATRIREQFDTINRQMDLLLESADRR